MRNTLTIALVNAKPGTGKTTSAVWLAHAFHAAGRPVLLVDADPARSALEWSDLADGFPFRVIGLAVRDLHRRLPDIARPGETVVIDSGQMEDHAGIARSAIRAATEVLIPCAPTPVEIARTSPMLAEVQDIHAGSDHPALASVLLNRTIAQAHSTGDARAALEAVGFDVLPHVVPRLELFAQSFGAPVDLAGAGVVWTAVARVLAERGALAGAAR